MLKQARRRAASLGLCEGGPSLRFVRADAAALPFEAAAFDTVLDTFSLCVLGDAAPRALAEMARVLRPNGCAPPRRRAARRHRARSRAGACGDAMPLCGAALWRPLRSSADSALSF